MIFSSSATSASPRLEKSGGSKAARHPFWEWLARARPGDRFVYHRGFLIHDRETDRDLKRLAKEVLEAGPPVELEPYSRRRGLGLVHLVQRRLGPGDYEYIAVRAADMPKSGLDK